MTVKITKPALNLREELASLRNQGSAYEESKFYLDSLVTNGTFDSDTSGWTAVNASTLSHSSGKLRITNGASFCGGCRLNGWFDVTIVNSVIIGFTLTC